MMTLAKLSKLVLHFPNKQPINTKPNYTIMKKTISIVVVTGDNVHHVEQIKSTHPSPISQAMANVAYRYRKAGKGSPTILKAY
jgi:hypothetical protein